MKDHLASTEPAIEIAGEAIPLAGLDEELVASTEPAIEIAGESFFSPSLSFQDSASTEPAIEIAGELHELLVGPRVVQVASTEPAIEIAGEAASAVVAGDGEVRLQRSRRSRSPESWASNRASKPATSVRASTEPAIEIAGETRGGARAPPRSRSFNGAGDRDRRRVAR